MFPEEALMKDPHGLRLGPWPMTRPVLAVAVALASNLACASSAASFHAAGAPKALVAAQDDLHVYYGNLHAHSRLSDGNPETTAAEAFQIARDEGGLDFLCLSEHNHMLEAGEMNQLIAAADAATGNGFVAMFGQEYSTIEHGGNHANIHNYPVAIPGALNGHYGQVFKTVLPQFLLTSPGTTIVAAFNHPRSDIQGDYGLGSDFGGSTAAFVAAMDPFVELIAIANGPSDSDNKGFVPGPAERHKHRDQSTARWFDYLAMGMHLAPEMDHDTHSATFGFRVAGRTAVWVKIHMTIVETLTHGMVGHAAVYQAFKLKSAALKGLHILVPETARVAMKGKSIVGSLGDPQPFDDHAASQAQAFAQALVRHGLVDGVGKRRQGRERRATHSIKSIGGQRTIVRHGYSCGPSCCAAWR